jgi:hypothetical protein
VPSEAGAPPIRSWGSGVAVCQQLPEGPALPTRSPVADAFPAANRLSATASATNPGTRSVLTEVVPGFQALSAASHDERDPEASRLSRAGLRALADDAADEP